MAMRRVRVWMFWMCLAVATPQEVAYTVRTIAGGNNVGDGQAALKAQISDAQGVAVDAAGNIYIADADNHRVRRVTPAGIIETVAGTGTPGLSGDGGQASRALLDSPYGVAVDAAGNLYIADLGNRRVRRVALDGTISTVAGNGQGGAEGDGGKAVDAQLTAPRNVAVDAAGNLFIADFEGHRIRRVGANGMIVTVAGTGGAGAAGSDGWALLAELAYPAGMTVDPSGSLYIADSGNNRIVRLSSGVLWSLPTSGLRTPTGVAVDAAGNVYVADSGNRRVVIREALTGTVGTLMLNLDSARDVALDGRGGLYVADGRRLKRLAGGTSVVIAGDGTFGYRGDGGPAVEAQLNHPTGLAVGWDGSIYIADERNHRVRKLSADSAIAAWAGTGSAGPLLDGRPAAETPLDSPTGISFDNSGLVWIAESRSDRVRRVTPGGIVTSILASPAFRGPSSALTDGNGVLYVADTGNHRVRRILPGGATETVAGTGTAGLAGDGGPALAAQLDTPRGLAFDAAGNLYIADSNNHRIRRVSKDGRIATVAGAASPLRNPRALAIGADGTLLIADTGNHRVVAVPPAGPPVTIAGTSTPGFSGDGGPALAAQFWFPAAIAQDGQGNILVADEFNNRVRLLSPQKPAQQDPVEQPLTVLNAASLAAGPVAPGEIVSIAFTGSSATETQVLFDGSPAVLLALQPDRVLAQVPYAAATRTKVEIELRHRSLRRGGASADVARAAPGLFTDGNGQALALAADGSPITAANPAARGSIVSFFATGEGQTYPSGVDGQPSGLPLLPVALSVGGIPCEVLYAGGAPGYPGLMQINARIPATVAPGTPLVMLSVGSARSQDGVGVGVR